MGYESQKMSKKSFAMIKHHEGIKTRIINGKRMAVVYHDPIGIPTIGWGFIYDEFGNRITMNHPPMSIPYAESEFIRRLKVYKDKVLRDTKVELNADQIGALTSFAFNLGNGAYRSSTLRKRINSKDWEDVPYQFSRWKYAGGQVFAGLIRRRKDEAEMFMSGVNYSCPTCGK